MEGRATAVAATVTLPNQPAVGTVRYLPLGGNGYTAPFAAHVVQGFGVTGAAGGGAAVLTVTLDDRFCSLISWVQLSNSQTSSADADFRLAIFTDTGEVPQQVLAGPITAISATVSSATLDVQWDPTPVILPGGRATPQISARMLNVADDDITLSTLVYLFNIRVRETTPMGPLLWARGAT